MQIELYVSPWHPCLKKVSVSMIQGYLGFSCPLCTFHRLCDQQSLIKKECWLTVLLKMQKDKQCQSWLTLSVK